MNFKTKEIFVNGKSVNALEADLQNGNLVLAATSRGFVMCGYLNLETAEKLGDTACVVTGIKDLEGLLRGKVVSTTKNAEKLGIIAGMSGFEALEKML
jgi:uncharacterized protein YunC (DUF1805 family)